MFNCIGQKEMDRNWVWRLNAIDKCRETAYKAKNRWFQDYWHGVADSLEQTMTAQPWLRTYDGKLN